MQYQELRKQQRLYHKQLRPAAHLIVSAARLGDRSPRRMMASSAVPSTTRAPMQSSRMDSHSLAMREVK